MFQLALVHHLRMTFGHIVYQHRAHAQLAYWRARWNRGLKAFEALLMTGVAVTALGAAFGRGYAYEIGSAVLASLAVICLILHVAFDLDGTAQAHAACATRLWYIRERYRALLSDLSDGAVDVDSCGAGETTWRRSCAASTRALRRQTLRCIRPLPTLLRPATSGS